MKKGGSTRERIQKRLKNQRIKKNQRGEENGQIVQCKWRNISGCQEFHVLTYDGGRVWVRVFISFVTVQGHWWRSTWRSKLRLHREQALKPTFRCFRGSSFGLTSPFPVSPRALGKSSRCPNTKRPGQPHGRLEAIPGLKMAAKHCEGPEQGEESVRKKNGFLPFLKNSPKQKWRLWLAVQRLRSQWLIGK